jgi:hypothetical protein
MTRIRYARAPSEPLIRILQDGLLAPLREPRVVQGLTLDLQLRERDTVHLYCGLTRLLEARLAGGTIRCTAAKSYTAQPCAKPLMRTWRLHEAGFEAALAGYLAAVRVGRRWTDKEGAVQAAWMGRHDPVVPIDREAVIGGGLVSAPAVDDALDALKPRVRGWAQLERPGAANEVDLLGVDERGRVAVVELKHGATSADKLYYAPLQALRYAWEWSARLERLLPQLEALVLAKQRLGMLPRALPPLRDELRVLVAWGGASPSNEVLRRTVFVRDHIRSRLPDDVEDIELWDEHGRRR